MVYTWSILLGATLLLLLQGACAVIKSCHDLKIAIEGGAGSGRNQDNGVMTLQLRSGLSYHCKESIRVAATQSVVITSDGDGLASVFVSLYQPPQKPGPITASSPAAAAAHVHDGDGGGATAPSLFVNEGMLRLSEIQFHLNSAEEKDYGVVGEDGHGSQQDQQQDVCVGVRLVRNFGHVVMEDSRVFGTPSFSGVGSASKHRCAEGALGRVVSDICGHWVALAPVYVFSATAAAVSVLASLCVRIKYVGDSVCHQRGIRAAIVLNAKSTQTAARRARVWKSKHDQSIFLGNVAFFRYAAWSHVHCCFGVSSGNSGGAMIEPCCSKISRTKVSP